MFVLIKIYFKIITQNLYLCEAFREAWNASFSDMLPPAVHIVPPTSSDERVSPSVRVMFNQKD
jgi:hypothetical protein